MPNKRIWVIAGILLLVCLIEVPFVFASTTITVDTTDDEFNTDGDCSLREAIHAADTDTAVDNCPAGNGNDTIILPAGIYTLTVAGASENHGLTGDLDIRTTDGLTIQGADVSNTIIDGGGIDRVFHVVSYNDRLTLKKMTIRHGSPPSGESAGGILNNGILVLDHVVVKDSETKSTPSQNPVGGGICNGCGNGTGVLTLVDTIISGNESTRGGGIFTNHILTITHSTITANKAKSGGGLVNYGNVSIINSTVSNNSVTHSTSNIMHLNNFLTITNSTINGISSPPYTFNIYAMSAATMTIVNTIVTNDPANYNCSAYTNTVRSLGHNLDNGNTCHFSATGDLTNTNPLLGPLASNGGATPTHALLTGSPAIDAGDNTYCPQTDQRWFSRPFGSACDIGAFEFSLLKIYLPFVLKN